MEALETGGEAVLGTEREEGGNAIRIAVVIAGQNPRDGVREKQRE